MFWDTLIHYSYRERAVAVAIASASRKCVQPPSVWTVSKSQPIRQAMHYFDGKVEERGLVHELGVTGSVIAKQVFQTGPAPVQGI